MRTLMVKDAPKGLHEWLRTEAHINRRSLNQQVLLCLEWCMHNPFAALDVGSDGAGGTTFLRGKGLADRLRAIGELDCETAAKMKRDVRSARRSRGRKLDYACFD